MAVQQLCPDDTERQRALDEDLLKFERDGVLAIKGLPAKNLPETGGFSAPQQRAAPSDMDEIATGIFEAISDLVARSLSAAVAKSDKALQERDLEIAYLRAQLQRLEVMDQRLKILEVEIRSSRAR